ncbi:MAG TPA: DUF4190 domain-containing protein [Xylella sp.]
MNIIQQNTSTLAIISIITSILGLSLLPIIGSLCAVITEGMARADIRRQPEALKGDELAIIGLVPSWIALAMSFVIFGTIFSLYIAKKG